MAVVVVVEIRIAVRIEGDHSFRICKATTPEAKAEPKLWRHYYCTSQCTSTRLRVPPPPQMRLLSLGSYHATVGERGAHRKIPAGPVSCVNLAVCNANNVLD